MRRMVTILLASAYLLTGGLKGAVVRAEWRPSLRVLSLFGERGLTWRLLPQGEDAWTLVLSRKGENRRYRLYIKDGALLVKGEEFSGKWPLTETIRVRKVHGGHRLEPIPSRVVLRLPGPKGEVRLLLEIRR
ncbi:hypothetical protein [Thermosulfurimonas sp. F29]|uniref:hypothetical protein n=1 Tax=Thermosulfurimonas sp. F29 TaxID=2867247 RepID=UPI001C82E730|nr:hypothetical protein [Thermosulfurimonas sp. F29]MBX6424001.1 hypothetical protein [Thermosulfurimonas sp. F29]